MSDDIPQESQKYNSIEESETMQGAFDESHPIQKPATHRSQSLRSMHLHISAKPRAGTKHKRKDTQVQAHRNTTSCWNWFTSRLWHSAPWENCRTITHSGKYKHKGNKNTTKQHHSKSNACSCMLRSMLHTVTTSQTCWANIFHHLMEIKHKWRTFV